MSDGLKFLYNQKLAACLCLDERIRNIMLKLGLEIKIKILQSIRAAIVYS